MADRYFVGAGSWNTTDTTVWSDTSGGTTGFSVPTSADDVFFDANSGACEITETAECDDLNFTGYTGTLSGDDALSIYGSLLLVAGMTYSYTGAITFRATATGKTLTFGGKTTASFSTFNGVGGEWTIQDTWNNTNNEIVLTSGSLATNGQTVTCGDFSFSNNNIRTLNLGSSTINCTSVVAITTTNLTFSSGTSTINLSGSGTIPFRGGGLSYNTVVLTNTSSSTLQITGANTFATLTITGPSNKTQQISLSANQTD